MNAIHQILSEKKAPLLSHQTKREELSRQKIEANAREYSTFLMSTFAKVMLKSCEKSDISIDEEIMGNDFLGDVLGEALANSGAGKVIEDDLLSDMLEMQGLKKGAQPIRPGGSYASS